MSSSGTKKVLVIFRSAIGRMVTEETGLHAIDAGRKVTLPENVSDRVEITT